MPDTQNETAPPAGPHYTRIRDVIRFDIVAGALLPGHRLKISALAKRYGVSAIPIREALQQLQGEGLVVMTPNCGATVRTVDERFLMDVYDVREVLDAYVARRFIEMAPAGALDDMAAIEDALERLGADGDPVARQSPDRALHRVMLSAVRNQEIQTILERQNDLINALRLKFGQSPARFRAMCEEHRDLLAAFRQGDAGRAADIAARHARNARVDLVDRMRQQVASASGNEEARRG